MRLHHNPPKTAFSSALWHEIIIELKMLVSTTCFFKMSLSRLKLWSESVPANSNSKMHLINASTYQSVVLYYEHVHMPTSQSQEAKTNVITDKNWLICSWYSCIFLFLLLHDLKMHHLWNIEFSFIPCITCMTCYVLILHCKKKKKRSLPQNSNQLELSLHGLLTIYY